MTKTDERNGFEERLLVMLREAVMTDPQGTCARPGKGAVRRGGPRRRALVALLAAVVGISLFVGSATGGRQIVSVDGSEALRDPAAVERRLREAGIDATIVAVPLPTVPEGADSWQGVWWWVTLDRPADLTQDEFASLYVQVGELSVGDANPGNTSTLELPKMSGHVTLFVGRVVPHGEPTVFDYDRINELSPAGAFFCLGIDPDDPAALGTALEARGYRVMWTVEDLSANSGSSAAVPPPGTVATWAWLRSPDLVDVRLAEAGPAAQGTQVAEGTFPAGTAPPWSQPC
jgi:hypothetical protein